MNLGEMIKQYRMKTRTTMQEFSEKAGVSKGYVSMLEKNQNPRTKRPIMPSYQTMKQIAAAMDLDVNALNRALDQTDGLEQEEPRRNRTAPLLGRENQLLELYRQLNEQGRTQADDYLAMLATMPKYLSLPEQEVLGTIVYYDTPVSAGLGEFMDSDRYIKLDLMEAPPAGAEFVVRVCGDSMEPTYQDGDKLYIAPCQDVRPGDVGIFYVNGSVYVKERGEDRLISHNPDYSPIYFHEMDSLRCYGRVLGLCKNYR